MTGTEESANAKQRYLGSNGDGKCRIEDSENPNAWIEAEYREGWWRRKILVNDDGKAYSEMIDAYYLKCQSCHRHDSPQMWTVGSKYCPMCEQQLQYNIPAAFGWFFGDDEPSPQEIDNI